MIRSSRETTTQPLQVSTLLVKGTHPQPSTPLSPANCVAMTACRYVIALNQLVISTFGCLPSKKVEYACCHDRKQLSQNSKKAISDFNLRVFAVKRAKYACCHDRKQLSQNSKKAISDFNLRVFAVKRAKYACCHDSMQLLHNSMKSISDFNLLVLQSKGTNMHSTAPHRQRDPRSHTDG